MPQAFWTEQATYFTEAYGFILCFCYDHLKARDYKGVTDNPHDVQGGTALMQDDLGTFHDACTIEQEALVHWLLHQQCHKAPITSWSKLSRRTKMEPVLQFQRSLRAVKELRPERAKLIQDAVAEEEALASQDPAATDEEDDEEDHPDDDNDATQHGGGFRGLGPITQRVDEEIYQRAGGL